ncbi:MAG: hypothetical protein PSN34_11045 [Urechidicola sp.]|nr:hypothetical protein [Urechidicola sp.]
MAPFKFEEDIKEVLEKRTIQPSKLAWNELEKSLDKDSGKNKKKPFWWIGIAASVVGILFIAISFFNRDNTIVKPTIVDVSKENYETPMLINSNTIDQKIISEEVIIDKPIVTTNTELVAVKVKSKTIKKETIPVIEKRQNEEIQREELIAKADIIIPDNISEEEKQLNEVAAQIAALENATESEIDLLLDNAQQKIAQQKFKESGMSVSAYALLFEVEEELDPTFKDKVFNILSENYHSVKNAVAQRNE